MKQSRYPYLPLAAFVVLIYLVIRLVLGFNGLYGQDAFEYLRYTRALRSWLLTGTGPGDYFWPVGYPLMGAVIASAIGYTALVLQLISVSSFIGLLVYGRKIISLLHGKESRHVRIFLLVYIGFSPFLLRSSLLCMADSGAAFFVLAACYHGLRSMQSKPLLHFVLAAVFAAASVMFRYIAVLVWLPVLVVAALQLMRKKEWQAVFAAALLAALVLLPHIWLRRNNTATFLQHDWLTQWSAANFFRADFITRDGAQHNRLPNMLYAFTGMLHPGYALVCLPLLAFFRRKDLHRKTMILLCGVLLYLIFLCGMPYQNYRFFIPVVPPFIFLLFPAFERAGTWLRRALWQQILIAGMIIVQAGLFVYGFRVVYRRFLLERRVCTYLQQQYAGREIYTMDLDISLQGYEVPLVYHNIWKERFTVFHKNALVLFDEKKWTIQWAGKNPMLNWQELKAHYHLVHITSFDNDWELYEIR